MDSPCPPNVKSPMTPGSMPLSTGSQNSGSICSVETIMKCVVRSTPYVLPRVKHFAKIRARPAAASDPRERDDATRYSKLRDCPAGNCLTFVWLEEDRDH